MEKVMTKAVFVTDLHGDKKSLEKVLRYGEKKDIEAVIIGGDIGPFLEGMDEEDHSVVQNQKDFIEDFMVPKLKEFRKRFKKDIFIIMGNDDFDINLGLLERAEKKGILKVANKKVEKVDDRQIIGYSYVNPMPFLLKDWEKPEKYIERDLKYLERETDPRKSIWLFHDPPFDTKLDVAFGGRHVGSKAVRKFIDKEQPLVTLHGHIHESPEITGKFYQKLGRTVSINPGNRHFVIFDLEKPIEMKIIKR
jgi:Icc-related predicted phosphoesterase